MTALEIKGLIKVYKGKKWKRVQALSELDLTVEKGEVFGFLGPNGAGKSTTIKVLTGQIKPTAGMAKLFGIPVSDSASRLHVGYLPENPALYDFMTAREYLSFVGKTFGMSDDLISSQTEKVLKLLELHDAAVRPVRGYSKGMVQRLGLAQALLHDPDLYILDEPMSGLDPLGRALVKEIIKDLKNRGKTVFFSTHITDDVEAVCDRVGILVAGRLQTVNTVEDVLQRGIEGYYLTVKNVREEILSVYEVKDKTDGICDVYVPRGKIQEFMDILSRFGGEIELIEPKRKDLEAFFLDIVANGKV